MCHCNHLVYNLILSVTERPLHPLVCVRASVHILRRMGAHSQGNRINDTVPFCPSLSLRRSPEARYFLLLILHLNLLTRIRCWPAPFSVPLISQSMLACSSETGRTDPTQRTGKPKCFLICITRSISSCGVILIGIYIYASW